MNFFDGLIFDDYRQLGQRFSVETRPENAPNPELIVFNTELAKDLGTQTDTLTESTLARIFSGNDLGQNVHPVAMAYAGHQFGHFVPQLGDGRAVLLGNVTPTSTTTFDLQLKGSGRTAFSRQGDGQAPLGPVLREYIVSEAMHALGVPTTRSLAAVKTGRMVYRETAFAGAVLTRVAKSHIRVGTFEYFATRGDMDAVKTLADFVIKTHYPTVQNESNPYLGLFKIVLERQAKLVAKWMSIGFIHGVMNTDNTSITAETIDFGPCAFMDTYKADQVFSYIDQWGRYAYNNQPKIMKWNMAQFARTLLPLIDSKDEKAIQKATAVLDTFDEIYGAEWLTLMEEKMGLCAGAATNKAEIEKFLEKLEAESLDFTMSFYTLSPKKNPLYIPRNHQIEALIQAAISDNNLAPFHLLNTVLKKPFNDINEYPEFFTPPTQEECISNTFCGT